MKTIRGRHRTAPAPLIAAGLVALAVTACATGGVTAPPPGDAAPGVPDARGVPGFDTRDYPGDGVMSRWLAESPYRWVGFYLPAPCYTGTSWLGKRDDLRRMGWGIAVLFVGEQDWPETGPTSADSAAGAFPHPADGGDRCTRGNLSADRGRTDGAAAAAAAAEQGFAAGAVVYLDVEPVESVSDSLAAYVEAWTRALAGLGYAPGLYAHARNADTLLRTMTSATDGAPAPRLWVASTGGFNLRRGPSESGFPAAIWQGELDVHESWGGTRLRIDRNVADRADPSG